MKVRLLFPDQTIQLEQKAAYDFQCEFNDLGFSPLLEVMARGDEIIEETVRKLLFQSLTDEQSLFYRQAAIRDCLAQPERIRQLYRLSLNAIQTRKDSHWWLPSFNYEGRFSSAVSILETYFSFLKDLRQAADEGLAHLHSPAFQGLLKDLKQTLDDAFLSEAEKVLQDLHFRDGMLIGLTLGDFNEAQGYRLLQKKDDRHWLRWTFAPRYRLAARDDAGGHDFSLRRKLTLSRSIEVVTEASENVEAFFKDLRDELSFYVGVLNLVESLDEQKIPYCLPTVCAPDTGKRSVRNLHDLGLALSEVESYGNDLQSEKQSLFIITGANQGGKSTFLRSMGQAQVMFQAGLPVLAEAYSGPLNNGIFTHFKKEEDKAMTHGKLAEELLRMSQIVDHLQPGSLLLCNESFASTNEREGSKLCEEITKALVQNGIEIFFVTHLISFACKMYDAHNQAYTFLRAERLADGTRTFRLQPGRPLRTAFGNDIYEKIFLKHPE